MFRLQGNHTVEHRVIPHEGSGGRIRIEALLDEGDRYLGQPVVVCGWAKSVRKQGGGHLAFIALTDGSCSRTLQVVVSDEGCGNFEALLKTGVSCSFRICGTVVASPGAGQKFEMQVNEVDKHWVKILGSCNAAEYPLAKGKHSREMLRSMLHIRPRSYIMGCVLRIRSALAAATHTFFQERGFVYIHAPLITASDCEGAGELFQVTRAIPETDKASDIVCKKDGKVDYDHDFFGKKAYLTVSGQLNAEACCLGLSDVYTFGPAFRAEDSHTSRHLSEFWLVEPEMAFADLEVNMDCAEAYLRFCASYILERHNDDMKWLDANVEEGLIERIANVAGNRFTRITYTEAIEILTSDCSAKFEFQPAWGDDLKSEHERYLAETVFKKPLIVYNYPKAIKAFYMKANEDGKTVRAMDVLVPKIGEVIGGSQREDCLNNLDLAIKERELDVESYWWYRDLRKYGTVPHSGFGLGFERFVMMMTGIDNIRDSIPFPRYPKSAAV